MKFWHVFLAVSVMFVLTACGSETSAPTEAAEGVVVNTNVDETGAYVSAALGTDYEGALPASTQLVLGTFMLEGTGEAVTPSQAKTLLSFWQAIQNGGLESDAEINAVYKQIEKAMTAEQLSAIAAMQLTAADMQTWMQEQGMAPDLAPEASVTRQPQGDAPGGFGVRGNLSEEEREAMRATAEAGDLPFGGGQGDGGFRGRTGQVGFLARPLIELLTLRAAE